MTNSAEIVDKSTGEIIELAVGNHVRIRDIQSSGSVLAVVPPYVKIKCTRGSNKGNWTGLISQCERI